MDVEFAGARPPGRLILSARWTTFVAFEVTYVGFKMALTNKGLLGVVLQGQLLLTILPALCI
jgi:hypothetical protein